MLNDSFGLYYSFQQTKFLSKFFLYNFQLSFYLVTSCIALIFTTCDNHLLHVNLVKKWLMEHTKMNPTEVTPRSSVLSQIFVVLTAFLDWVFLQLNYFF